MSQAVANKTFTASVDANPPRRGVLACGTALLLFCAYWVYSKTVTPLVLPPSIESPEKLIDTGERLGPTLRNLEIAKEHLPQVKWAGKAKYQLRTSNSYVFAEEAKPVDAKNGIRFKPFAMVWMQKGRKPGEPPITITSDSAYVRFASKFGIKHPKPGRVIGGSLDGNVEIRGPNGMRVWGRDFAFSEASMKMWSDAPVRFAHGPHRGRAHGIQCELLSYEGPRDPDRIAVNGIQSVRLIKDVVMNLVFEDGKTPGRRRDDKTRKPRAAGSKSKKKPVLVKVQCDGNFNFGVQTNVATFEDDVSVFRPTEPNKFDVLKCDLLTLIFEPDEKKPPPKPQPGDEDQFQGMNGKLTFRRMRAKVRRPDRKVLLISEANQLTTYCDDLIYDAQTRVAVLTDPQQVRVLQDSGEMRSPKITLLQDKHGTVKSVWCQGAGWLRHYDKRTRKLDLTARWERELKKFPDPDSDLDIIDLRKNAVVLQPKDNSTLKAQSIRLWVDRRKKSDSVKPSKQAPIELAAGEEPERDRIRLRRMLALTDVTLVNPKMEAKTKRLEAWFEQAEPGAGQPALPKHSRSHLIRATHRKVNSSAGPVIQPRSQPARQGFYAVEGSDGKTPAGAKPKGARSRETFSENDGPMKLTADLIQARIVQGAGRDDSQVKEVKAFGRVKVTQEHEEDDEPLLITGNKLHIVNRSADDQVLHVYGEPAHIRDRGRHMQGGNVHLDRGKNLSWVDGPGLLEIPVDRDFEGNKLPEPRLLDVWWKKHMTFDGERAKFRGGVRSALADSRMRCGEMDVYMSQRVSFTDKNRKKEAQIHSVVCSGIVDFDSYLYVDDKLMEMRRGRFVKFTMNQTNGNTAAEGPGHIVLWRRGGGKRASLTPFATAKANAPAKTEKKEWEYTRIDFAGRSLGNSKQRFNTFHDRVRIVYGPVDRLPHTIDADDLPKDGGWMRSKSLQVTQYEKTATRPAYVTLLAKGNAELEGRKFHGRADSISYDESKGLYLLRSMGRNSTMWRQLTVGGKPDRADARSMKFIPAENRLELERTTSLQGLR